MENDTCIEDGCANMMKARSLCMRHYGIARRNGSLAPIKSTPRHVLSHVDVDEAIATCAVCVPVKIRVRGNGKSHECMTVRSSNMATYDRRCQMRRYKYGITSSDYQSMIDAQRGLCAICKKPSVKGLVIDHDHNTGAVRQLLCYPCNSALGFLRDDIKLALAAADYLIRHSAA